MENRIKQIISEARDLKQKLVEDHGTQQYIQNAVQMILETYAKGGKVWFCGNGGSAADAQHLAAELSGRFYFDRPALAAEALHVNTSYLTAVANDYSYEMIYARYLRGAAKPGDVLIGISTSGNSSNVVNAMEVAKEMNVGLVSFTGAGGGKMKKLSDICIEVPSSDTPRIQECHIMIGHIICELVESSLFERKEA